MCTGGAIERELVEALDCRVPHLERSGEVQIAKDAALLRGEAVAHRSAISAEPR